MAEISGSSSNPKPTEETTQEAQMPEFDPKIMRTTKPGLKRLIITLTVLISFILGFPLVWRSIEIYRAPLPFHQIDTFSSEIDSQPLHFPCHFQAIFLGFESNVYDANGVVSAITKKVSELNPIGSRCGDCGDYSVSVVIDSSSGCARAGNPEGRCSWKCGEVDAVEFGGKLRGDDEEADEVLRSVLWGCLGGGGKVYSVVVVNGEEEVRAVVGKYRHAWVTGRVSEEEAVVRVAEIFARVFVNGGSEESAIRGEFMPVGADGRVVLSFSLLNADPRDWIYDWYEP